MAYNNSDHNDTMTMYIVHLGFLILQLIMSTVNRQMDKKYKQFSVIVVHETLNIKTDRNFEIKV